MPERRDSVPPRRGNSLESTLPGVELNATSGVEAAVRDITYRTRRALQHLSPTERIPTHRQAIIANRINDEFGVTIRRGSAFENSDDNILNMATGGQSPEREISESMIEREINRMRSSVGASDAHSRNESLGAIPKQISFGRLPERTRTDERDHTSTRHDEEETRPQRPPRRSRSSDARRDLSRTLHEIGSDEYELVRSLQEQVAELTSRLSIYEPPSPTSRTRESHRHRRGTRTLDLNMALKQIHTFDGNKSEELDSFTRSLETIFDMIHDDDYEILLRLVCNTKLIGRASRELKHKTIRTVGQLVKELESLYGQRKSLAALQMEFSSLQQRPNEDISAYAARAEKITAEVVEKLCETIEYERDARTVELVTRRSAQANFENGLHGQVQVLVRARNYKTLHEAVAGAIEISHMVQPKGGVGGEQPHSARKSLSAQAGNEETSNDSWNGGHQTRENTRKSERVSLPAPDKSHTVNYVDVICNYCKRKGHVWKQCRKLLRMMKGDRGQTRSQQPSSNSEDDAEEEEVQSSADMRPRDHKNGRRTLEMLEINMVSAVNSTQKMGTSSKAPKKRTLRVLQVTLPAPSATANDFKIASPLAVDGMLTLKADTGAQCSLIKKSCLRPDTIIEDSDVDLQGVGGRMFTPLCKAEIILDTPAVAVKHWFYVVADDVPLEVHGILGIEFMKKHKADILGGEVFKLYGHSMPLIDGRTKIKLPPRCETTAYAAKKSKFVGLLNKVERSPNTVPGSCDTSSKRNSHARSRINMAKHNTKVRWPPMTPEKPEIRTAERYGKVDIPRVSKERAKRGSKRPKRKLRELDLAHLESEEQPALAKITSEYHNVFHRRGTKLSCTNVMEYSVLLNKGVLPAKVHPYLLPKTYRKKVNGQIKEMLADGITQPRKRRWKAPLIANDHQHFQSFICYCNSTGVKEKLHRSIMREERVGNPYS